MMKSNSNQIAYKLSDIKKRAKQSLDKGAVTENYPLD
ncbi:Uncharacterised protein [Legionella maceachernii]|nr:Uncharacterised protein [Legionella maceachernii]